MANLPYGPKSHETILLQAVLAKLDAIAKSPENATNAAQAIRDVAEDFKQSIKDQGEQFDANGKENMGAIVKGLELVAEKIGEDAAGRIAQSEKLLSNLDGYAGEQTKQADAQFGRLTETLNTHAAAGAEQSAHLAGTINHHAANQEAHSQQLTRDLAQIVYGINQSVQGLNLLAQGQNAEASDRREMKKVLEQFAAMMQNLPDAFVAAQKKLQAEQRTQDEADQRARDQAAEQARLANSAANPAPQTINASFVNPTRQPWHTAFELAAAVVVGIATVVVSKNSFAYFGIVVPPVATYGVSTALAALYGFATHGEGPKKAARDMIVAGGLAAASYALPSRVPSPASDTSTPAGITSPSTTSSPNSSAAKNSTTNTPLCGGDDNNARHVVVDNEYLKKLTPIKLQGLIVYTEPKDGALPLCRVAFPKDAKLIDSESADGAYQKVEVTLSSQTKQGWVSLPDAARLTDAGKEYDSITNLSVRNAINTEKYLEQWHKTAGHVADSDIEITADAPLRKDANTASPVVGVAQRGSIGHVESIEPNGWVRVSILTADGTIKAYMQGGFATKLAPTVPQGTPSKAYGVITPQT